MQKAKAQWGGDEAEGSSSSSGSGSETSPTTIVQRTGPTINYPHISPIPDRAFLLRPPTISASLSQNLDEQATNFYINRYIIGHPDEPRTAQDLSNVPWIWSPILSDAMVAVGLAGISNLNGDAELMTTAQARYGQALRQAGLLLGSNAAPSHEAMRLIVMLALFEVSLPDKEKLDRG